MKPEPKRKTLREVMGDAAYDSFFKAWESYKPHRVVEIAFEACDIAYGYDISLGILTKEEQDAIFLAVLDAMPNGEPAAYIAAQEALLSLAVAGGWDEWLLDE